MHNIFGDRFISREQPAWHNLGSTFDRDEEKTVAEAMQECGADYTVSKHQLYFEVADGRKIPVEGEEMIVRSPVIDDPEYRVFGTVRGRYKPVQNMEVAEILDRGLAGKYPVETLGVLGSGEQVFIALRGSDFAVNNADEIRSYFVVDVNHKPGNSNSVLYTPVRVVCYNTLTMARRDADISLAVPHTSDPGAMLSFGTEVIGQMVEKQANAEVIFNAMANHGADQDAATRIIEAAFQYSPRPQKTLLLDQMTEGQIEAAMQAGGQRAKTMHKIVKSMQTWEYWATRVDSYREAAFERLEAFNDEHSSMANTVWAVYNAVTETSDWRDGRSKVDESVLFGDRAAEKRRAFEAAVDVVG